MKILPTDTLEYYQDKFGEYRCRLTDKDMNIVEESTTGYKSKAEAEKDIERKCAQTDTERRQGEGCC